MSFTTNTSLYLIAVYSKVFMEIFNALCEQNLELINVQVSSTYSFHYSSSVDVVYK
jgi:hypothetical protein